MKKRRDCFFGLHFDFHASDEYENIGALTDAKKVGEFLDAVKPDFIEYDTKGHPGYASYFTEYGTCAPGFKADQLKIIREETKKRGILLFAHYSSHVDINVAQKHPEWTIVMPDGKYHFEFLDFDSPYYKTIMLPMLKELAVKYDFDGVWMDGDINFSRANYSKKSMEEFREKTGFDHVHPVHDSESMIAFYEFNREHLEKEIAQYTADLKAIKPGFEVLSSWANSMLAAEKSLPCVDENSNDLPAVQLIGFAARAYAGLDMPWDLMTYGFARSWSTPGGCVRANEQRHIDRVERDAALVISLGGIYQICNMLGSRGQIRMAEMERMSKLSGFLRARQPFCQGAKLTKDVAVWCSKREMICLCGDDDTEYYPRFWDLDALYGVDGLITDGGRSLNVVYDDVILSDKIFEHPVIIIPEIAHILPEFRDALVKYMEKGGKVIAIGAAACKAFTELTGEVYEIYFEQGEQIGSVTEKRIVTFPDDMEPITKCHIEELDWDTPTVNAAAWKKVGDGALYCIGWDMIHEYAAHFSFIVRDFMRTVLDMADPEPEAYLEKGFREVQVIPVIKDGKKMVNLINMVGSHEYTRVDISCYRNEGALLPICDLTIAVKYDKAPEKLWFEPEHKALEFTYDGKYAHVKVPRLDVHGIIVAE